MEMEGKFFQPTLEAEPTRTEEVRLTEEALRRFDPTASFDGSRLSLERKEGSAEIDVHPPARFDGFAEVMRRMSESPETADLVEYILLRPIQQELARSKDRRFDSLVVKIGTAINRMPGERKTASVILLQKEEKRLDRERHEREAKAAAERKALAKRESAEQLARRQEEDRKRRAEERIGKRLATGAARREAELVAHPVTEREKAMNLDYLFSVYRAKWLASGGHTDPATFAHETEAKVKWAQGADQEMRLRLKEPGTSELLRGTAMELFLGVELEEQRWFGGEVVRVAAADDFANSLDLAMEWPEDEELGIVPRLAIDFTTAEGDQTISKKLAKLGKGTSVNFFRSKVEDYEGRVEDIPMVILGLNGDVLSEVGAALLRGEKMSPDHPLRALLLRQAEIQVGLQIRKLAADLVANALEDRPNSPVTRAAVRAYADGMRGDPGFSKDVTRVGEILRSVSEYDMAYFLKDRRAATRLRHLLAIHRRLGEQLASADAEHPQAKRLASSVKLSRRLEAGPEATPIKTSPPGEVFGSRFARLLGVGDFLLGIPQQALSQPRFRVVRFRLQRCDRRAHFLRRSGEPPFRRRRILLVFGHTVCYSARDINRP